MIEATINTVPEKTMDLTEQLNAFFIEHEKKAFVIANMSLKNQDDALDVVQDVMLKFVDKYKHKPSQHWAPLFFRMVQNRITDFHRKNSQNKKRFTFFENNTDKDPVEQVEDDSHSSILEIIETTMQIKQLQTALHNLPARQLQAFMCRLWEGLSIAQTAKSMKCSQGSVKTHLFRALKQIRIQLKAPVENNNDK